MFFFSNHEILVELKEAKSKTERDAEAEMMACNDAVDANRSGNENVQSKMETRRCNQSGDEMVQSNITKQCSETSRLEPARHLRLETPAVFESNQAGFLRGLFKSSRGEPGNLKRHFEPSRPGDSALLFFQPSRTEPYFRGIDKKPSRAARMHGCVGLSLPSSVLLV